MAKQIRLAIYSCKKTEELKILITEKNFKHFLEVLKVTNSST